MKRMAIVLSAALIFSVCSTNMFAVEQVYAHGYGWHSGHGCQGGHSGCGKGYVDADGDGVCDHIKYAIKYNLNGGKNNKNNPLCYCSATKTIKLKNPTKKGCTFQGWYADRQCRKKITAIKKGSNGTKTLYAKWRKK